jgi:predicted nucleic acid-binding protein
MTIVVADTSPIRYLLQIDRIELLPRLYRKVTLPQSVLGELAHPNAPAVVQAWSNHLPEWVTVRAAARVELAGVLDAGEAEAIALAQELRADLVLIDEREARGQALKRGLRVTGTIGVLEQAAARGWLDLPDAFRRLSRTNFRIDPAFVRDALARDAGRKARRREIDR